MTATATTANAIAFPHLLPTTAIGWLKAIGLLRLSGASGYWENDCFYLEIDSVDELVEDILANYQPKPFASPWNGSSVFDKKHKTKKLQPILASKSDRYSSLKDGYQKIEIALQEVDVSGASADKKLKMIPRLKNVRNEYFQQWRKAVGLLNSKNEFKCNELLGSGGIIGNKDLCTDYLSVCLSLWDLETGTPTKNTADYVYASIAGRSIKKTLEKTALLAHTHPAGDHFGDLAPNDSDRILEDYLDNGTSAQYANPFDLILYLEGAATFAGTDKPLNEIQGEGDEERTITLYPLLLEVNSGSADTSDRTGRAYEVWFPLWNEPLDWEDFQDLVFEDLSFRLKHQIVDTLDMLDAIAQASTVQGLSRFSRFGLWTRKGTKSDYLVHIGLAKPGESDIGAELRPWQAKARPNDKQSQAQYNLLTAIYKALYRLQQGNAEATTVIRLLGQLELLHSHIQPKTIPPVPRLSESWVEAVYKEASMPEVQLAAALASAIPRRQKNDKNSKDRNPFFWGRNFNFKLKTSSLRAFCLSLLKLWCEISSQERQPYNPAQNWTTWASPDEIAAFIAGQTNDQLILELAIGFALCRIPKKLGDYSANPPLPEPYKYAASLQWTADTNLTMQTINALLAGSTVPLGRQLSVVQKPAVLPPRIASGDRSALALVFPCRPFYTFGESK